MKKKVLLTGGSGFIGRNLTESLGAFYELRAPKRSELDLLSGDSVRSYLESFKPDVLIHSATTPGHRNAVVSTPILESNLKMFFNLTAYRSLFGQFIHLGSGSEYDMRHYLPEMKESYFGEHVPIDPSGFSKYIISRSLEADPLALNLRLFGVFGKYEDYEIRFISNAICKTLIDRPITIKQNRRFSYLFIDDLAPILRYFVDNKPRYRVYNVTPDEIIDLSKIGEFVKEVVGKPSLPIEIATPGMGPEYSGANNRLHEEIASLSFTPISASIKKLADWYSEHRSVIRSETLLADK